MTELESQLLPKSEWSKAPQVAQDIVTKDTAEGIPSGIGRNDELGFFVISSSGQGPMLLWSEKNAQ